MKKKFKCVKDFISHKNKKLFISDKIYVGNILFDGTEFLNEVNIHNVFSKELLNEYFTEIIEDE